MIKNLLNLINKKMKNENELQFVGNSKDQLLQTEPNQNYSPVPDSTPNDGSTRAKLINAKMVRIRIEKKWAFNELKIRKPYYLINTISKIDDNNPQNENESPLLEAELIHSIFCSEPDKFNFYDAQTKQPYSISRLNGFGNKSGKICCFGQNEEEYPDMSHSKVGNLTEISVTKCYDSKSFYRTFEYQGKAYYKIGRPYKPAPVVVAPVAPPPQKCLCVCPCLCFYIEEYKFYCLFCDKDGNCNFCCCKNEQKEGNEKRTYVDIFNMSDQSVGKYVHFFGHSGFLCFGDNNEFYEVYFPPDANELFKLSLIGHLLFIIQSPPPTFWFLPGSKDNLASFVE